MSVSHKQTLLSRLSSPTVLAILFLLSAGIVLILSPLFQKGSFIDAMLYKTVAFNYAIEEGSFWSMKYTNTSMQFFCEQPPLYMYLLGNFYALFGTHFLVDRVFTFFQFLVFLYFLYRICSKLFTPVLPFFLLNLFLLLCIQVICWSFANQVIETMVLVGVAAAINFYLRFLINKKRIHIFWFSVVLLALFLTKGFQSCFVIVLPLSYALFHLKDEKILWFAFFSSFFLLLFLVLLVYVYEPAKIWYQCYFQARLVLTLNNVGATTNKHYQILLQLLMEIIAVGMLLMVGCVYLLLKKKYTAKQVFSDPLKDKLSLSLLVTFLAGSLPFTLSLVQRGFYLVPAYLCLVLFLTYTYRSHFLYFFEALQGLTKPIWMRSLVLLIFVASLVYFALNVNQYKREKELAHDLQLITPMLKQGSRVGITSSVWNYFNLHSYLYMQRQISLSAEPTQTGFVIVYKNQLPDSVNAFLHKIELPTEELDLYYRVNRLDRR